MKKILLLSIALLFILSATGCQQSDMVSYDLSKQADNFNVIRQITVVNAIQGDVVFQMTGRISIESIADGKIDVIVENAPGQYAKHFLFIGDNGMVTVEQIGYAEVDQYNYSLNYNPKMWLPVKIETID